MGAARERGRRIATTAPPATTGRGTNQRTAVLALQRSAGNRAVQRALEDEGAAPAISGVGGEEPEQLGGGLVNVSFTKRAATFPAALQSSAATYNDLLVELTAKQARGEENGRTRPGAPKLTVGGKDASGMADDDVATSGVITIADAVELPSWTNVARPGPTSKRRGRPT